MIFKLGIIEQKLINYDQNRTKSCQKESFKEGVTTMTIICLLQYKKLKVSGQDPNYKWAVNSKGLQVMQDNLARKRH